MFVLSLAFVDPYNNESQFGDLTGYDELSKQAIVLLIPELVSCGDGKETEILPGARRQAIKKIQRIGGQFGMDEMGCTAVRGHRSPAVVLFLRK